MNLVKEIYQIKALPSIVTIGFFDGVHRGHQALLMELKKRALELNAQSVVITFWPPPRAVLSPHHRPELLSTPDEKYSHIEGLGIDYVLELPFNRELSSFTARQFVEQIINVHLPISHLLLGYDHRFGSDKSHELSTYQELGQDFGFSVSQCPVLLDPNDQEIISSSSIRKCLHEGELQRTNRYLGYSYTLKGTVVEGIQLGQQLGFPTANIRPHEYKLIPQIGVYAVRVQVNGVEHLGMLNIGYRPSVNSNHEARMSIEVHLFHFKQNLYGENINIQFVARIRDEQKFQSLEALKEQLIQDQQVAERLLGSPTPWKA